MRISYSYTNSVGFQLQSDKTSLPECNLDGGAASLALLPDTVYRESLTNLTNIGQIVKLKPSNIKLQYISKAIKLQYIRGALMTWIIRQTLFCQNVEIENSPNFNDVKVYQYTVATLQITLSQLRL